jgi:hypothetical protein
MLAVDVVPTTNKLITDAVLFEKLTVSQLVKNFPECFRNSKVRYIVTKSRLFFPAFNQINPVHGHILSVQDGF